LNICYNDLGDSGAESLSALSKLIFLYIQGNNIRHLDCFRSLENLRFLFVKYNPIRDVPESIFDQWNCIKDLRIWWQETSDKAKVKPNKRVKLQIIGNGNAGKSSIVEALKMGVCEKKFTSTHGIVIEPLNYGIDNENINFNVWDFGGQEIYHGTHQLFIASQSIHLIVEDDESEQLALDRTRVKDREKPDEMVLHQPLQHYIDSSKRQSPGSIRVVVKNKIDVEDSISNNSLKTIADKNGLDFHAVSATQGTGILELRKILAQKREDILHYGMLMPVSWLDVQNYFLANMKRKELYRQKLINQDIFNEICANCKVTDIARPALLDFLHHTGILYKNKEFLKDTIIADQRWALEAIYKPLDRKSTFYDELRNDFKGRVRLKYLFKAFGVGYETEHKWLFLNFMRSCGLCFPLYQKDAEETEESYYIFPEFLPENETPAVKELWKTARDVKVFTYHPEYLDYFRIQKFIVDLGNKTKVEYIWKSGILVVADKGKFRVEVSDHNTKIKVSMEATTIDDYLWLIIKTFKESGFNNENANWLTEDGKVLDFKSLEFIDLRKESLFDSTNSGFQGGELSKEAQDSERGRDKKADLKAVLPDVEQPNPKRLVISYASENLKDRDSIVESLLNYELNGAIQVQYDDKVVDGRDLWDDDIKEMFLKADGYLMLVSLPYQNFKKHPYIWDKEIPIIESRNAEEKVFAYCISVAPVKYNNKLEKFASFKGNKECLPESGHERDKFLVEFAEKVIENKFLVKK
jgi:GTPase SAR1 family protein